MRKIYFILFLLSFSCYHLMAEDNTTCDMAIAIPSEGGKISVVYEEGQTDCWYFYTATDKDILLKIPSNFIGGLTIKLYEECGGEVYSSSTAMNGVELKIPQGKTYYVDFYWTQGTAKTFDYTITTEETIIGGATCNDALLLKDGENKIPSNLNGYMYETWVTYTPAIDGKFIMAFQTSVYSATQYETCESTPTIIYSDNNTFKIDAKAGVPILLKFTNKSTNTVAVSCAPVEQGDERSNPFQATLDDGNTCKAIKIGDHWYKFTTARKGILDISACGMSQEFTGKVLLYGEANTSYRDEVSGICPEGNGFYLRYAVEAGETYFINIQLTAAMADNFNFSVANIDFPQGWTKENPVPAINGDNPCSGLKGEYWYSYTVNEPAKVKVSNIGVKGFTGGLYLYNEELSQLERGTQDFTNGGYSLEHNVEAGTYLIKMSIVSNNFPKFNLNITGSKIEQGSECANPIPVVAGDNSCSGNTEVWYSYMMAADGFLTLATSGNLTDFTGSFDLYTTCDGVAVASSTLMEGNIGATLKYKAKAGTTYLIKWSNTQVIDPFTFVIGERAFAQGEDCGNPLSAVLGENALNLTEIGETYYSFTPEQDGWMNLSICNAEWTVLSGSVKVMTDCSGTNLSVQNTACEEGGQIYKVKVKAGIPYVVCIANKAVLPTVNTFTLSMAEYIPGENCEKPVELVDISKELSAGITNGSIWYQFVTDKAGNYTISSANLPTGYSLVGGTLVSSRMSLKMGDCSATETNATNNSGVYTLTVYAEAGVKMLVNIVIHKETSGVTWKVDYAEPELGTICAKPIEVSLAKDGVNLDGQVSTGGHSDRKSLWYAVIPDVDGKMTVSTCHESEKNYIDGFESMYLYSACDIEISAEDIVNGDCGDVYPACGHKKTIEVKANTVYLLNLQTAYPAPFPIQFSLEEGPVSIDKVMARGLSIAPNPNAGAFGVDLSVFGNDKELEFEVINSQGQIIYKERANSNIGNHLVRLSEALQGIYFLKVTENDKVVTTKFIVK